MVNDLHAAGDAWFTQSCDRAADHEWVFRGNQLIGRREDRMDCGLMAGNNVVKTLVLRLWQGDAPDEPRETLWWLPTTFVTSLDSFMVELANDLHDVATQPAKKLPLRIREHWFTVAYSITLRNTNACVAHEESTHEDRETDGMDVDPSEHGSNDSNESGLESGGGKRDCESGGKSESSCKGDVTRASTNDEAMELDKYERVECDAVDGCGYVLHAAEGLSDDEAMADEVMAMFDFDGGM